MKHTTIQIKTHQNTWTGTQTQWQTKKMRHAKESHYNLLSSPPSHMWQTKSDTIKDKRYVSCISYI